jgi:hypothetical protein
MMLTALGLTVGIRSALGLAQLVSSLILWIELVERYVLIFAGAPLRLAPVAELAC